MEAFALDRVWSQRAGVTPQVADIISAAPPLVRIMVLPWSSEATKTSQMGAKTSKGCMRFDFLTHSHVSREILIKWGTLTGLSEYLVLLS